MKSNRFAAGFALATLMGLGLTHASPAQASFFFQNSTGLTSPTQAITFDEVVLPANTAVTNQYAAYGVTFTSQLYYDDVINPSPNITGGLLRNFSLLQDAPLEDPFGIHFATPQTAAAFAMATSSSGTSSFIALLGGNVVEMDNASTSNNSSNDYYGFRNTLFDEIRVAPAGPSGEMLLDNLQTIPAPAPEPGSLALLLTGGLPLLGFRRRRVRSA